MFIAGLCKNDSSSPGGGGKENKPEFSEGFQQSHYKSQMRVGGRGGRLGDGSSGQRCTILTDGGEETGCCHRG